MVAELRNNLKAEWQVCAQVRVKKGEQDSFPETQAPNQIDMLILLLPQLCLNVIYPAISLQK